MKNEYGYIRVSSISQKEDRQLNIMKEYNLSEKNIFVDKVSGKDFNRPEYKKLLERLMPGDLIYIKSIDRLGRNYSEILEQWRIITKEKKANINVIDMPLLNTDVSCDNLTGVFISDLVLQILAYVAETEREFIKQRQMEGIAVAKINGIHLGRPKKQTPSNFAIVVNEWEVKKITLKEALKKTGMKEATFYRRLKEYRNGQL